MTKRDVPFYITCDQDTVDVSFIIESLVFPLQTVSVKGELRSENIYVASIQVPEHTTIPPEYLLPYE